MQLKRLSVTVKDDNDFSSRTEEEKALALTEMEQECINRIMIGLINSGLIHYEVSETDGHGYRATATLGVYDIKGMPSIPEEKQIN